MENQREWFKEGTSNEEKEVAQAFASFGINQESSELRNELFIHTAVKELIKAVDEGDEEAARALFPGVDILLREEEAKFLKKQDDIGEEFKSIKQEFMDNKISKEDAAIKLDNLALLEKSISKRIDYLSSLATEVTQKLDKLNIK